MIRFVPCFELPVAIERGRSDAIEYQRARGEDPGTNWQKWAGSRLSELMRSRETTAQLANSEDSNLRLSAISLIAEYWPPTEQFAAISLRLAFEDDDERIRGAALVSILAHENKIADGSGYLGQLLNKVFDRPPKEVRASLLHPLQEQVAGARSMMRTTIEKLAGNQAKAMLESRASAETQLSHAQPDVRRAAILALKYFWEPDENFSIICEKMVFEDPDLDVRSQALSGLAGSYIHTDDKRIGTLTAGIVYDQSQPPVLRMNAYRCLFSIRGMPIHEFLKAESRDFRFPEDVDWAFVDSFLPPII